MKRALMLGAALAPLLAVGAQAGTNLVQNGSFSMNTLPSPLIHPTPAERRLIRCGTTTAI